MQNQPFFEVRDLRKKFGKLEVLKGVSLSISEGEIIAVIGSSGSGKSTLLRCLTYLEFADAGEIYLNGEQLFNGATMNLAKMSDAELRSRRLHFGLVFQSFNLFPQYSVIENLMLAPKLLKLGTDAEIRERAEALLARVNLSDKADAYPCQLSGGQQQRVAIARALALNPEILFFDEPTSALDPELTVEVLRVIKELKDSKHTMVIVTHEMEFARKVADRVIFFADGVIEEEGSPEEFFQNPKSPKAVAFLSHTSGEL